MKRLLLSAFAFMAISNLTYSQTCTAQGDQTTYGINDVWIGYVYSNPDFTGYVGYVNEGSAGNPFFDQSFGGDDVMYATNGCPVQTESFSIRYKLRRAVPNGTYRVTIAGDDGYRLSLDGGATWVVDESANTGIYTGRVVDITLSGTVNAILEYKEITGGNRINFQFGAICIPSENQATYGTNNIWKGYVYDGINFNTYKGMVTQGTTTNPSFDQSFGGASVTYNTSACPITTDNFSVRYRLNKTFAAGNYTFVVSGDAGYRLSFDGGTTWAVNNWVAHTYQSSTYTADLTGTYNMVLEYYDQTGANRVTLNFIQNIILPVNLLSFTGKQVQAGLELDWKVSEDSNPDYFLIEKSANGVSFEKTGLVTATAATSYSFTDASINTGNTFYRMKMTDRTGATLYSNVITIRTTATAEQGVTVFPNIITGNSLYLSPATALQKATVIVTDASGHQLNQQVIGKLSKGQVATIATSSSKLPAGMYFLQVLEGNTSISVKRFIVK